MHMSDQSTRPQREAQQAAYMPDVHIQSVPHMLLVAQPTHIQLADV
jgi:hypothetical protein